MILCTFYVFLGIVVGILGGLGFSTADKKWKKNSVSVAVIPITIGLLASTKNFFELENKQIILPSTCYIIALTLSFSLVFVGICYLIKTQRGERVKLRVLDIVLGYSKALEQYYENRQDEIRNNLNLPMLEQTKRQADYALEKLKEKEQAVNAQLDQPGLLVLKLPDSAQFPLTSEFLDSLPLYVQNYADFCGDLEKLTLDTIAAYDHNVSAHQLWTTYFISLCNTVNTVLFDTHKATVRSHVRVLNGDCYVKFMTIAGEGMISQELTPIPKDQGMIYHAFRSHTSLVKSLNPGFHFEAKNDSTWKDYITIPIDAIEKDGSPVLSLGVSVSIPSKYRDLLYLINLLQIEKAISNSIGRVSEKCSFLDFLNVWGQKNREE